MVMPTLLPSVARAVAPIVKSTSEGLLGRRPGGLRRGGGRCRSRGCGVVWAGVAHPESSIGAQDGARASTAEDASRACGRDPRTLPPLECRLWLSGSPCSRVHHERIRLSVTVLGEGAIDGNL